MHDATQVWHGSPGESHPWRVTRERSADALALGDNAHDGDPIHLARVRP